MPTVWREGCGRLLQTRRRGEMEMESDSGENVHLWDEKMQPGQSAIQTPCSEITANESHLAFADNEQTQLHGNIRGDLSGECFAAPFKKNKKSKRIKKHRLSFRCQVDFYLPAQRAQ